MADTTDTYYQRGRDWWVDKDPDDDLYYGRDVQDDLTAMGTTAAAVTALVAGVELTEAAFIQGTVMIAKVKGGISALASLDAVNSLTFRVTCANSEQFDKTVYFNMVEN